MFQYYTEDALLSLACSRLASLELGAPSIEPEHLLLGVVMVHPACLCPGSGPGHVGPRETLEHVRRRVRLQERIVSSRDVPVGDVSKLVLKRAEALAREESGSAKTNISPRQLVLGILAILLAVGMSFGVALLFAASFTTKLAAAHLGASLWTARRAVPSAAADGGGA